MLQQDITKGPQTTKPQLGQFSPWCSIFMAEFLNLLLIDLYSLLMLYNKAPFGVPVTCSPKTLIFLTESLRERTEECSKLVLVGSNMNWILKQKYQNIQQGSSKADKHNKLATKVSFLNYYVIDLQESQLGYLFTLHNFLLFLLDTDPFPSTVKKSFNLIGKVKMK